MIDSGESKKQINLREEFIKRYSPQMNLESLVLEMNLQDLKSYCEKNDKFLQQCVEIGIYKGLCCVLKDKTAHFLVKVDDNAADYFKFLYEKCNDHKINITMNNDLKEKNILNYFVDIKYPDNIDKYNKREYFLDNLLKSYKASDEKVRMKFKRFIAVFYYVYTKEGVKDKRLDNYYFIAKDYLSEDNKLREAIFTDYLNNYKGLERELTHKLRRLFKYDDYSLKDGEYSLNDDDLKNEKVKYILESGMGKISKTNDKYNVIYKSNTLECDSCFFLECIREIKEKSVKEDDFKKYIG